MADGIKLTDEHRKKLDGILVKMVSNNETDEDIDLFVNDFKTKYGQKKNGQPPVSGSGSKLSENGSKLFQDTKPTTAPLYTKEEKQRVEVTQSKKADDELTKGLGLTVKSKGLGSSLTNSGGLQQDFTQNITNYRTPSEQGLDGAVNAYAEANGKEAEVIQNYAKPQEILNVDTENTGGRGGYVYNKFLQGIGSVANGLVDVGMQASSLNPAMSGISGVTSHYRKEIAPQVRDFLKEKIGTDVDKGNEARYDNEFITSSLGGLANSVPAILTGGAGLRLLAYDSALQSVQGADVNGELDETTKTLFAGTVGEVVARLEKAGLDRIFKGRTVGISQGITKQIIEEASKKTGGKITGDALLDVIEERVKAFAKGFSKSGLKVLDSFGTEFTTGAGQEVASIASESLLNKATGKSIFDTTDTDTWEGFIKRVGYAGLQEGAGGTILGVASEGLRVYNTTRKKKIKTNTETLAQVDEQIDNENLSDVAKEFLVKQKITLENEIEEETKAEVAEQKDLTPKQKEKATEVTAEIEKLEEVVNDPALSKETKALAEEQVKVLEAELSESIKPVKEAVTNIPEKVTNDAENKPVFTAEVAENIETDLSAPVFLKAEDDLTALKQVSDKTKKYEASIKRLIEAKKAKLITPTEFDEAKARFDDVLAESGLKVPKITAIITADVQESKPFTELEQDEVGEQADNYKENTSSNVAYNEQIPENSPVNETLLPKQGEPQTAKSDIKAVDEGGGDKVIPNFTTEEEATRYFIENETDPEKVASSYYTQSSEPDYKESGIMDYLGTSKINARDYARFGDNNNLDGALKTRWIDSKNSRTGLDVMAMELSDQLGIEVEPEDIVDTITRYRTRKEFDKQSKSKSQRLIEDKYYELTGKNLTDKVAEKAFYKVKNAPKTDKELYELNQDLQEIGISYEDIKRYTEYDKSVVDGTTETVRATDNDQSGSDQVRGESEGAQKAEPKVKTKLELAKEKMALAKAKLKANNVNLGIYSDPKEKAKDLFDYHASLVEVAKEYIKEAGTDIKEFAEYVGEKLNKGLSDAWEEANGGRKLNETDFEVKVEPKVEDEATKKAQKIKDSVDVNAPVYSGIRKAEVSDEIIAGVNLDKISDKEMRELGKKLVDEGGIDPKAIIDEIALSHRGLQPKEVVALQYYKNLLTTKRRELLIESNRLTSIGESTGTIDAQLNAVQDDLNASDVMSIITASQQSLGFRLRRGLLDRDYNLVTQIEQYKKTNGGFISDEMKAKFTAMDKELTELRLKLELAEIRALEAQELQSVTNIKEDVQRSAGRRKSVLKPEEQRELKILANKYRVANDVTRIITILAEKDFRRYAKLVLKEASGDFKIFANELLKNVGADIRIHLPKLYEEIGGKGKADLSDLIEKPFVKDGELIVPSAYIRDLVENGVTDIDKLSEAVQAEVQKDLPNITIREVRDAITKYGKTVNQSSDEIQKKINEAKRLGKLYSGLEDLKAKKKRAKSIKDVNVISLKERELLKQIKVLEFGLPKTPAEKATDAALRSIQKRIKALSDAIIVKSKIAKVGSKVVETPEIKSLRELRDKLQEQYDEINDPPKKTTAEKATESAIRATEKRIKDLTDAIASKTKIAGKTSSAVETAELKSLRDQREALQETYDELINPKRTLDEIRLENKKKYLEKYITEKEERLRTRNFNPKPKPKPVIADDELSSLEAQANKIRNEYDASHYDNEQANRTPAQKFKDESWNWATGSTRALVAGLDFGAFLVQGSIFVTSMNPKKTAWAVKKSFLSAVGTDANPIKETARFLRELGSETYERNFLASIRAQPYYNVMKSSKLALQEPNAKLGERDDALQASVINKIWNAIIYASHVRLLSPTAHDNLIRLNPYRASERAYTGAMNGMRIQLFLEFAKGLEKQGITFETDPELFKSAATTANNMTFRGGLGFAEGISKQLSFVLFAPRKITATLALSNPYYWFHLWRNNPVIAKQATLKFATFITMATTLTLVSQAFYDDDEEEGNPDVFNPYSSDFMKLRLGNTRINFFQGMDAQVVLYARYITANYKSASSVKTKKLGQDDYTPNRGELLGRALFVNKQSPTARLIYGWHMQSKGSEIEWDDEIQNNVKPMWVQGMKELEQEHPREMAGFLTFMSFLGLSSNTYGGAEFIDKTKDAKLLELVKGKNAFFQMKTKSNININDPKTGEERSLSEEEYELFKSAYGKYVKDELKANYRKYADMPVEKFEKELKSIKSKATEISKLKATGILGNVAEIEIHTGEKKEKFTLTPELTKERLVYLNEYLSNQGVKDRKELQAYKKEFNMTDTQIDLEVNKSAIEYSENMISEKYAKIVGDQIVIDPKLKPKE